VFFRQDYRKEKYLKERLKDKNRFLDRIDRKKADSQEEKTD